MYMEEPIKARILYNTELLQEYFTKGNASSNMTYSKLTQDSIINFICSCGENTNKKFLYIVRRSGAYCKICSEKNRRAKTIATNIKKYGCIAPGQNKEIIEQIKKTCLDKYGVSNPGKDKQVREKMKETMLKNHGAEYAFQVKECKEKSIKTLNERYGVSIPYHSKVIRDRGAETCKKIYGVENPFQNKEIKEKIVQTNMRKYGVEHPSQNNDIMLKAQANAKKYKKYTMPSGEVRNVQGYEPFALRELLKIYDEGQIKTDRKEIPRIKYTINEKERYYFPDIYIPHDKKIIEVKSTWTYKCKNDNIISKKEATEALGYLYEMWIFDAKGVRILP